MFSLLKNVFLVLGIRVAQAAILYEGGTIISFNSTTEALEVLRNASLLIENDRVTCLCEGLISNVPSNTTRINATGRIISPGYVDAHHHLWQTAFKTIGSNTTLADYLQKYSEYGPAIQKFMTEDIYLSQLTGSLELLHEGTTTVLDHAHGSFSDAATDASVSGSYDSGVRTFYAHAIHILPNNYTFEEQTAKLRSLATDHRFVNNDLMHLGLAYDDFYGAPAANLSELWSIVTQHNLSLVTSHYMNGPFGWLNSPQLLDGMGWLNTSLPVIFSHAAFLTTEDARVLQQQNQYIASTPESEFHYGRNHPNIELILDQGAVGVDTHFTFSSSMVQQARLWLQSLRWPAFLNVLETWHVPTNNPMSAQQAFMLVTRAGGLALRRPDLGVLNVGSKADVVVYRGDSPNMLGWSDPVAAIVLHSNVGDIEDVLVDGKFVKRNGKLLYPHWASVKARFQQSAQRIQKTWAETDWPALTGGFNGDFAPYASVTQIDTLRGNGTGY